MGRIARRLERQLFQFDQLLLERLLNVVAHGVLLLEISISRPARGGPQAREEALAAAARPPSARCTRLQQLQSSALLL